ncbi:MAG: hypothetical protein R3E66_16365 [bacterium]
MKFNTSRANRRLAKLAGAVLAASLLVASPAAFALDKNQIVQMSKLGLDDKAIMGAIDGAGAELKLSPEDIGELRLQGVSDTVIEHLKKSGRVSDTVTTTPTKTPTKDVTKPVGDGIEPAPAPAEGETEEEKAERERLQKERDAEILKKAEELNQQKAAEEQREARIEQVGRRLPEAAELTDSGDNMEAARIYLEFLSLNPEEGSEKWYEAKFGLAKSLYQQGILSGASTPLLEVLLAGADKKHFGEAFKMLENLTREIGYRPPVLEELTQLYVGDTSAEFQANFNYYMGKFFFDYNKSDLAIEYLTKVPQGSPDYPEAMYVMGIARLDPAVNDIAGALYNFQSAIVAGEAEPGGNAEILQLGYLALARTWYEVGLYDVALFYYQKIPNNSSRNAEATFETTWTYFLKNDYKRALGSFQTLHSPYYAKWYFPDLYILEATVYVNLCKFNQAKIALAEFQKRFLDKQPRLSEYLMQTTEPKAYWEAMMGMKSLNDNSPLPRMFAEAVLDDIEFYNIYTVVQNLQNEKAALQANIGSLGEFGQSVLDRVDEQLNTKIEEGGILVQQKLSELDKELTDWDLKATQISFDIESEDKRQLEAQLLNKAPTAAKVDTGTTFLIVADDWQSWDFEGEYWIDEVPNYRSSLRTECIDQ